MKQVSEKFKTALKQYGRQIDVFISYTENGVDKLLDSDTLFSVTPITNGNLLKSVMKQLNFESSVIVPKGTIINLQFGVMVDMGLTVQDVNAMRIDRLNNLQVKELSLLKGFEYIDFGNYVVAEEPEYNADTLSYTHKCYDKMLYAMQDYENLNVTYPIKLKNYLNSLATKIGLTLKQGTFYNENKNILNELYLDGDGNSLGYTYRDVLDEIAQATGSIICISNDDKLEVRYLNETNETINADMLKDVDVGFKEHYGAINVVVLSRSAGADNIYYPEELPQNPVEIKIQDNQILNYDNRDNYIQGIYNAVNGINYYINDYKSTGICYLELGDKYNVEIDGVIYNCVLLNDEIDITQGLEEQIHTDMPEQSVTDYKKADTTDNRIKKTIFEVNKQAGKIEGIIEDIGDRSQKTTTITADIDGLNSKVENIEDLTNTISGIKTITLENCIEGNLLELHIYGNNTVFEQLYPRNDLYPSNDLFPSRASRIIVTDENNNSVVYELGITEVLRQNGDIKDEYVLQDGVAKIIRRINQDGTIKTNEVVEDLGEFYIYLAEGTNTITIQNYTAQIKAKFAIKSEYTEVFATRIEMNSSITQTAEEINLEVRKKVDENEVISKINQSAEAVTIDANKISLNGKNVNLTGDNVTITSNNFNVDKYGNMTCNNAEITGGQFNVTSTSTNTDTLRITNVRDSNEYMYASPGMIQLKTSKGRSFMTVRSDSSDHSYLSLENDVSGNDITITEDGIICQNIYYNQTTSNIPNMQIGSDGTFRRSTNTSTQRYKTEIKDVEDEILNPQKLYDLKIKQFKYKKEYQPNEKDFRYDKTLVGFIAEDVSKIYPIATDYDDNGNIENWNERYIIPPMLKLIQEQHIEINKMKEEIEKLRKEINNG